MNSKVIKRLKRKAIEIQDILAKEKKYYTKDVILKILKKQWLSTPKNKRNSKKIVFVQ